MVFLMKPVEGIIGPGISPNDLDLALPDCVRIVSPAEGTEFKAFMDTVVRATNRNAVRVLRSMLGPSDGGTKLASEFETRLGV